MKASKSMYRLIIGFFITTLLLLGGCQSSGVASTYGAPIDTKKGKIVEIQQIISQTTEYEGKNIIVNGKSGHICLASGCWMMLGDGQNSLFVQFYNFTVRPKVGTKVRVQGVLKLQNKVPMIAAEGLEILS